MSEFQTFLKDCDCKGEGVIHFKKKIHCRWCRKPYAHGDRIQYKTEHFEKENGMPKDWKIISFASKEYNWAPLVINGDGTYGHGLTTEKELLSSPIHRIESAQRLSDGEVFTVGDRVVVYSSIREPIEEFTLNDGVLKVNGKNYSMLIESIKRVPKEYEILSIVAGGVVSEYTGSDHQDKLLDFGYPINSIKRVSDGEIFSIGDTLDEMEIGENVITGFFANYKGNTLWVSTNNERGYGCSLCVAKKKQKALFNTEDGVEVFSWHDVVWWVNKHWYYSYCQAGKFGEDNIKDYKYFSTEKEAREYILLNKPVSISYKELSESLNESQYLTLKDFFKSKINQ